MEGNADINFPRDINKALTRLTGDRTSDTNKRTLPGSSCQVLVLPVRDVLSRSVVSVFLGQSEVDEEELVTVSPDPHEEVVRLNVSVDEVFIVNIPSNQTFRNTLKPHPDESYSILPII